MNSFVIMFSVFVGLSASAGPQKESTPMAKLKKAGDPCPVKNGQGRLVSCRNSNNFACGGQKGSATEIFYCEIVKCDNGYVPTVVGHDSIQCK